MLDCKESRGAMMTIKIEVVVVLLMVFVGAIGSYVLFVYVLDDVDLEKWFVVAVVGLVGALVTRISMKK